MAFENLFIRTQRFIGGVQLDTVTIEDHDNSVLITKNPVEDGVDITDHAIIQPKLLFIQGAVTDTPLGAAAFGQLVDSVTSLFGTTTPTNGTRSQNAYNLMLALMEAREPFEVSTKLRTYNNMLMTSLKTVQDKDSSRIVLLNMVFEEIITTESATINLTEADVSAEIGKSITPTVERGRQEALEVKEPTNTSVLFDIFGG